MAIGSLTKSDCVVFLLGAGASAEHGPPVMREFMRFARHRYFDHRADSKGRPLTSGGWTLDLEDRYRTMLRFHEDCERSSSKLLRDWNNVEELYTQADLCRLAAWPNREIANDICDAIAWVLWDVYRVAGNQALGALRGVCKRVEAAQLKPVVITTNYDLIAETALSMAPDGRLESGCHTYPGFGREHGASGCIRVVDELPRKPSEYFDATPVIKLHGSVNWFRAEFSDSRRPDAGTFWCAGPGPIADDHQATKRDQGLETLAQFHGKLAEHLNNPEILLAPEIVPPMLGKSSMRQIIECQWRCAIDAIRRAEQIWVVGYSFPTTDAFMQRLLHEGLAANRGLDWFVVADIQDESAWDARLGSMLNPVMRETQFCYRRMRAGELWEKLARMPYGSWLK